MLHRVGFIVSFILALTALHAQATVVINSVSGVSNTTAASTSGSTSVPFTFFGSKVASCPSGGTGPCDTCQAASFRTPCSRKGITTATTIRVNFSYTATATTTIVPLVKANGSSDIHVDASDLSSPAGAWLEFTWNTLCTVLTSNCSGTIQVGIGTDSSTFSDKVDVRVITGDATSAVASYTVCPPGTAGVSNQGLCYFQLVPGDEKLYVTNMQAPATFPASGGDSTNPYSVALFYYQPVNDGQNPEDAYDNITFATPPIEVAIGTGTGARLTDDRLQGLDNDRKYCFALAMQDAVGNVSSFTPPRGDPNLLMTDVCGTPEQVIGLLDDKHCFIATAAWGSEMDPHVDRFRQFRNKYLLPYEWGRSFVRTYYKLSPPLAQFISENEVFRAGARVALWPLLGFANASLEWGLWPSLILLFGSFALLALIVLRPLLRRSEG